MTNVTTQKKQLVYDKTSYCNPYHLVFEKRKIYKYITSKVNYIKIFFLDERQEVIIRYNKDT